MSKGFLVVIIATTLSFVGFLYYTQNLVERGSVSAETIIGGSLPEALKALASLKLEGGLIGEFYNSSNQHKVSILRQLRPNQPQSVSVNDLLSKLDRARLGEKQSDISDIVERFTLAQFNPMSAGQVKDLKLKVNSLDVEAQAFVTTRDANYVMALLNTNSGQVLFLVMHKGAPVDLNYVSELLVTLPVTRSAFNLN